jgi:hypothetical protein
VPQGDPAQDVAALDDPSVGTTVRFVGKRERPAPIRRIGQLTAQEDVDEAAERKQDDLSHLRLVPSCCRFEARAGCDEQLFAS